MCYSYDVVLSFAGADTLTSFVDHLYGALVQLGIQTFKKNGDKEEAETALKAIEESRCAIVIFSRSYASSDWCLDELVKIMERNKAVEQIVLPVFYYDFSPSDLRKIGGVFGELFAGYDFDKVRAWTAALAEAANFSGITLNDHGYGATCIKAIAEMVMSKLGFSKLDFHRSLTRMDHEKSGIIPSSSDEENLIGMEHRVQEVKALLESETERTGESAVVSSFPPSSRWKYDVFISFRGNDISKEFADQLYCALHQKGIYSFKDDKKITRSEPIALELLKAIEESYVSVVIFSKNYAASSQCLDELVKIMICHERIGQLVLPVFYGMDPSDVRNQKGYFGEAFMQHKTEKVVVWRKALVQAGSLAGWYLNCTPKSHEATIIERIVDTITRRLAHLPLCVDKNLIGIEPRMIHVMSLLKLGSGGVHMLGIHGMGGVGKTTIARAVFDNISKYFDGSCFIENIREVSSSYGPILLQKEVLSKTLMEDNICVDSIHKGTSLIRNRLCNRKVLVVLDDVDHTSQLEALAGAYNWFGEGSRIMITTRDLYLLVAHNVKEICYVNELEVNESIQFLKRHAFNEGAFTKEFENLLLQAVHYAAGLPLALKVLSASLCGKSKKEWTSTLLRLQAVPEKDIYDKLKLSYDGLEDDVRDIFLLIACFFIGLNKDTVVRILDSCGFLADYGTRVLEQKSLIRILDESVQMHDLLQEMGRVIVCHRHPQESQKHTRQWHAYGVTEVVTKKMGAKEIVGIAVDDFHGEDEVDMSEAFKGLKNLKLLQINGHNKLRSFQGIIDILKELRWLSYRNYPLQSLPESFEADSLVGLELPNSNMKELWKGIKFLGKLHHLDLSYSRKLIRTPDFTRTPDLRRLILDSCSSLVKVHKSIGSLQRLSILNLRRCRRLKALPLSILGLRSLRSLNLEGCSGLKRSSLSSNLLNFHSGSRMMKVPSLSIEYLPKISKLHLDGWKSLEMLSPIADLDQTIRFPTLQTLLLPTSAGLSLKIIKSSELVKFLQSIPEIIISDGKNLGVNQRLEIHDCFEVKETSTDLTELKKGD